VTEQTCLEEWRDEIGCDGQPWHRCVKESTLAGYLKRMRKHECRCGAYFLEDSKERAE
jgi:hypothetical protein